MEKHQDVLSQKYGGAQLAQSVNQMHRLLANACAGGSEETAQKASNFLSWLIFGTYSSDVLTEEYRQHLLQNNAEITSIINELQRYAKDSALMKELGRQYRLTGDKEIAAKMGAFSQERGIFTEEALVSIVNHFIQEEELKIRQTGTDQMTVWIPSWTAKVFEKSENELNGIIKQLMDSRQVVRQGRNLRFAYKDVKMDTMADNPSATVTFQIDDPELNADLAAVYQVLGSATIKSKNDLKKIDLEDVTIIKAYSAFINYSKKKRMSQTEIKNLFIKYYQDESTKHDPYITLHLNHLIATYALTGLGTTLQSDLKGILDGAKYLVAIDNTKRIKYHI